MTPARILVVEDEGILAVSIERKLKKIGHEVVAVVDSGEEAIVQADMLRPDLVLMDIKLSGKMGGIEAAEQIYAQFKLPVVYLSAYGDEDTLRRAQATRSFGYLKKPFTGAELQDIVEMALLKYRTMSE